MQDARALVDSGATESFVDHQTAEWWGLSMQALKYAQEIINADGTENKRGLITKACILRVWWGETAMLQKFYVTNLGHDRVILGYPWLHESNPHIDWSKGTFDGDIWLEMLPHAWQIWKEQRLMMEVNKTNFAQEWAHAAMKDAPIMIELPKQYECHKVVFLEEATKRFPLSQPEDHVIVLEDGAPATINCKIYLLVQTELQATWEFLDKNLALGYIQKADPA